MRDNSKNEVVKEGFDNTQTEQEKIVDKIKAEIDSMTGSELVEYLEKANLIDVYLILRDIINLKQTKMLRALGNGDQTDKMYYQRYQNLKLESKHAWDYDNKMAQIKDVNKASTNVYGLLLKMMKANNDDIGSVLTKVQIAINKIEDNLKIERTIWVDVDDVVELPIEQIDGVKVVEDIENADLKDEQGIS